MSGTTIQDIGSAPTEMSNEEFDQGGLMRRREASPINDVPIREGERKFHWPLGPRPQRSPWIKRSRIVIEIGSTIDPSVALHSKR